MNADSNSSDLRTNQMSRRKGVSAGSSGALESIPESNGGGKGIPERTAPERPKDTGGPFGIGDSSNGVIRSISAGDGSTRDTHARLDFFGGSAGKPGAARKGRRHTLAFLR